MSAPERCDHDWRVFGSIPWYQCAKCSELARREFGRMVIKRLRITKEDRP